MTRDDALAIWGGDARKCAEALGITTQAVYAWPPEGDLPDRIRDRILGAAYRLGLMPIAPPAPAAEPTA